MKRLIVKLLVITLTSSLLASCAHAKKVVTNGHYTPRFEQDCMPQDKGMYAFESSAILPVAYTVLGEISLTSTTTYSGKSTIEDKQLSMFNLALLVAWENCADAIVDIHSLEGTFTAKAVVFNEPIEPDENAQNFYRHFAQYVENEAIRNEEEEVRASQVNSAGFSAFLLIGLTILFALGGEE